MFTSCHAPSLEPGCSRFSIIVCLAAMLALPIASSDARAQCVPQWLPGDGFDLRGGAATDVVNAVVQMPNGDLVVGGQFASVAGVAASSIARWNGAAWSPLGSGIQGGEVRALAVLPNGDVIAGGVFTQAGGVPVNRIARWDGASWSALGSGVTGSSGLTTVVAALAVLPSGSLVVGGHFTAAGGTAANNVAQWNGAWASMGAGLTNPVPPPPLFDHQLTVKTLAVRPNGTVAAGTESFSTVYQPGVSVWDGTSWSPLGMVVSYSAGVQALASLPNNDLIAAAKSYFFGWSITRWNGAAWASLGTISNLSANVRALAVLGNGDLVCAGAFSEIGGVPAENVARWNGVAWSSLGDVGGEVATLATIANGLLVAGGKFGPTGTVDSTRLGRWGCDPTVAAQVSFGRGCYWRAASFYQHFASQEPFDLSSSLLQLSLTPTGYDVVHVPGASAWHTPTAAAEALTDDSVTAPIALPFSIPYPGGSTNQIVVGSNGFVFLQPSADASPFAGSTTGLLQQAPRHAPMWSDLDPQFPGTGTGSIHVDVVGLVVYVTWLGVQEYGQQAVTSTFQVALSGNGNVEYRYLACDHLWPALVGWSPGLGSPDPTSRDLSAFGPFSTTSSMFRLPLLHTADQRPKLGSTVTLTTSQLDPASVLGLNLIGFTKYPSGIELSSIGMPDCHLFTSLDLMFPFFPAAQSGSHSISIPNQASLAGFELHAQGVAWDSPANAAGMTVSNGLTLTIGNP